MKKLTSPPYVGDRNHYYKQQLFIERWVLYQEDKRVIEPVFSLYYDKPGLINAKDTFVELNDPTGYKWAIQYLGSWRHFQELLKAPWFREAFSVWLEELNAKTASEALVRIKEIAEQGGQQALAASKYLVEQGWQTKRGRPSKAEVRGELKKAVEMNETTIEDMARIGLKVIEGGANG